ncbi:MAG: hypothetical protein V4463_04275 [Pseudomonadota bacterium]
MSHFRLARISLILAAIGLTAAPVLHAADPKPAAEAPKPETVRPEMFKLIETNAIKELITAKKFTEVQDRINQAAALPNITPFETFILDNTRLRLAQATNNGPELIKATEAMIASGRLQPADKQNFIIAQASTYYNTLKNYPKAIEQIKRYLAEGGDPEVSRAMLIRSYYLINDNASAIPELTFVIDRAEKAGKVPQLEDLKLLSSCYGKLKDYPNYLVVKEKEVKYYPTPEAWSDVIHRVMNKPTFNQSLVLDVLRLLNVATKTMEPEEYTELVELALKSNLPGEAKKVIDAGYAAGVLGTGSNAALHKKQRDQAVKSAADDVKNATANEAAANKSKDGTGLVNLGFAFVTTDQFDKGIELMQKGIAKGGLKRPAEARLQLAEAYAMAGRKDEAIKAFEGVTEKDGSGDLARYWIMWLNRPGQTAAAAPAAK